MGEGQLTLQKVRERDTPTHTHVLTHTHTHTDTRPCRYARTDASMPSVPPAHIHDVTLTHINVVTETRTHPPRYRGLTSDL